MSKQPPPAHGGQLRKTQWLWVMAGMGAGALLPWHLSLLAALLAYNHCHAHGWARVQAALACLYGGLSVGLGLYVLICYARLHQYVPEGTAPYWPRYRCETRCGVVLEHATLEAIWSHCGRYLVVLCFADAHAPKPERIAIIDCETATCHLLARRYPEASFIWFAHGWLDLSYLLPEEALQNASENRPRTALHAALTGADYAQELPQGPPG